MDALYLIAYLASSEQKLYICDGVERPQKGYVYSEFGERVRDVISCAGDQISNDYLISKLKKALKDSDQVRATRVYDFLERNPGRIVWLDVRSSESKSSSVDMQYRYPNYPNLIAAT